LGSAWRERSALKGKKLPIWNVSSSSSTTAALPIRWTTGHTLHKHRTCVQHRARGAEEVNVTKTIGRDERVREEECVRNCRRGEKERIREEGREERYSHVRVLRCSMISDKYIIHCVYRPRHLPA
jgi:hypothetical protein